MSLSNLLSFIPDEALNSFINDGINSIDSIIMSAIKYLQALEQLLIAHHLHNKDLLLQVSNKITSLYTAVSNFALLKSLKKEECTNQSINSTTLSQESTNTQTTDDKTHNSISKDSVLQILTLLDSLHISFHTEEDITRFKRILDEFKVHGEAGASSVCSSVKDVAFFSQLCELFESFSGKKQECIDVVLDILNNSNIHPHPEVNLEVLKLLKSVTSLLAEYENESNCEQDKPKEQNVQPVENTTVPNADEIKVTPVTQQRKRVRRSEPNEKEDEDEEYHIQKARRISKKQRERYRLQTAKGRRIRSENRKKQKAN